MRKIKKILRFIFLLFGLVILINLNSEIYINYLILIILIISIIVAIYYLKYYFSDDYKLTRVNEKELKFIKENIDDLEYEKYFELLKTTKNEKTREEISNIIIEEILAGRKHRNNN